MGSSDDNRDGADDDLGYDEDDDFYPSDQSPICVDSPSDSDADADADHGLADGPPVNLTELSYAVLTDEDIKRQQEEAISQVSAVLSVSREESCLLLRHFNWSQTTVHESWFSDEEAVRKDVGLIQDPIVEFPGNLKTRDCGICFDEFKLDSIESAACGHPFCKECWDGYISTSINTGPGCLNLRCPEPSCKAAIGLNMVNSLASDVLCKQKYDRYLLLSFVEESMRVKWCPAPDCQYALTFPDKGESYDVSCKCLYRFCWKCLEDAHSPLDCNTVAKWILKNNAESENTNWILAYTKPCPKCKKPIEKNNGCMHMTCRAPCTYQFCWLCLGDWAAHHRSSNGCNAYRQGSKAPTEDEKKEMAKKSLQRYTHYYERWAANLSSRRKAESDLQKQGKLLVDLSHVQSQPESQLKFIIDAWNQIIECRRVLMWTYVYGYYLPENEKTKKELFEFLQGQAESNLERLHVCVEKELAPYLKDEQPSNVFNDFRTKLCDLTIITRNFFENLVSALENDLPDVNNPSGTSKKAKGTKNKAESSSNQEVDAKRRRIIRIVVE